MPASDGTPFVGDRRETHAGVLIERALLPVACATRRD
jgi:hypothetical protein